MNFDWFPRISHRPLPAPRYTIRRNATRHSGIRHSTNVKPLTASDICKHCEATFSFVVFLCPSARLSVWNNAAPTGRIFMKFENLRIFFSSKSRSRISKFLQNLTRITGTLHADRYPFLIIFRSVLLKMKTVSDKSCRENQNTHFVFSNPFSKIVPFIIWKKKYIYIFYSRTGHRLRYGACAFYTGYLRLQTHTQNM